MTAPMSKLSKAKAQELAESLHSIIIRSRGECEAAPVPAIRIGCAGPLQDAHIIPRQAGHQITMFTEELDSLRASWCLCAAHHRQIDTRPDLWAELVFATVGFGHVQRLRDALERPDPFAGLTRLRWWRSQYYRLLACTHRHNYDLRSIPKKWRQV